MMNHNRKVCIIGCGASGLSVAYLLQQQGWKVTIISKDNPFEPHIHPGFSSLFPAASIIPHSVSTDQLKDLFLESQHYFMKLFESDFPGLNIHEHFELFTAHTPVPGYAKWMNNFKNYKEFKQSFHPVHPDIEITGGWKFNSFFADWSLYYPTLLKKVMEHGAEINIETLTSDSIHSLPFEFIVNCSELGAMELFEDKNNLIHRGHLLHVLKAPLLQNLSGQIVSYNFTPGTDIYVSEDGNAQDVYCYPRSDGWILGGSRLQGNLDASGSWIGEDLYPPIQSINGTDFPAQIFELNAAIIHHTFGLNLDRFPQKKVRVGYRYFRKNKQGLRLEKKEINGKLFIHNYGHGGSGVTLSWGCAKEVAKMLPN